MKNDELDNIDKMIITMLQENARMSLKEIAQKVYLSSPAVSEWIYRGVSCKNKSDKTGISHKGIYKS
mgnify:CR=1 FL=1